MSEKCEKCGGAGWVWGRELDNCDEDTYEDSMTQYFCDWCDPDNKEYPSPTDIWRSDYYE
ncbi:hypothetical protein HN682_03310 [Candidatus Peregrinibacteria bacterium]|jgi:hypothetical protein|nr:hypothetical protein [Candidatus Peregrinibacteria bacterium]